MRKPRGRQRGKSYTISCTDAELEAIRAGAAKAGKNVSQWFVECALTVDPWPERHKRLVLDAGQQRAVVRGVEEIARGLGAAPQAVAGRVGGKPPQFIADLRALFETRLRRMAAQGGREEAMALLREVFGDERAEALAAAVIPEAPAARAAPVTPRTPETPEEGGTGEGPERDADPQGRLL